MSYVFIYLLYIYMFGLFGVFFILASNHHMSMVHEFNELSMLTILVFPHNFFLQFLIHHG